MLFCAWVLHVFVFAAVFFPRDLIDLAGWIILLMAALALVPPDIEISFRNRKDE